VLVLASQPTFDANRLEEQWDRLINDPAAPLLDRAALGRYPLGDLEDSLFAGGREPLLGGPAAALIQALGHNGAGEAAGQPAGYSPLQVALAAAAVTGGGLRPAPQIVLAERAPDGAWESPAPTGKPASVYGAGQVQRLLDRLKMTPDSWWQTAVIAPRATDAATWLVGGSLPNRPGPSYAIAIILEEENPALVARIAGELLK
jgi:hypothetical protein